MRQLLLRNLLVLLLTVLAVHHGWAQGTTTSSLVGTVTDQKGEPLPGATIIAIHTPTGTQYVGPTNSQGRYSIQNMRVGGPYTVKISFVGFQDVNRTGIQLTVGQDYRLDTKLGEATTELGSVEITATNPRSVLNAERSGPVTNITTEQLQQLPTISRSLNDFLRLTPQAAPSNGALAIGGGNYRQNNITIDGSDFNNNFGIGGNLPGNGQPISLDAVQEITVNIAPFDVRQSGFVGSAVNAVTRSGTNQVQGSVYGFFRNQKYYGTNVGETPITINNSSVKQYGFRVGGPIIKDKLFFFLNAERSTEDVPGQQNVASSIVNGVTTYGTASNITRANADSLARYSRILQSRYGYDTGPYQGYNFQNENTRILGRIDWNINDKNHLSVRYNQVQSNVPSFLSTSRSPLASFPNTRSSLFALPYANSNYSTEYNFYSGALELNSTLGSHIFNTLRATYTHQNEPRSSNSSTFPFVDILDNTGARNTTGGYTSYGSPYTSFGYEPFTAGNLRDVETYSAVDFITGTFGRHTATFGGQFDLQSTKNGFQRFATSYYTYNSWADFANGANPVDFALTYSLLPGYEQAFPRFKTAQYSVYGQDEIAVSDRFRLTLGLRAELNSYLSVKEIQTHPLVAALDFNGRKIDTGVLPTNRVLLSPRIGFNWDVKGNRTLQLRGGAGIFSGKVPTVWIVAQSGDAGLIQITQTYSTVGTGLNPANVYANLPGFANGVLPFSADPNAHRPTTQPTPGTVIPSTISATDPNFRNPQTFKSSLALDAKLPGGLVGTLEGAYNLDLLTAYGQNYNLVNPTPLNVAGYADNREIYPNANSAKFINPLNNNGRADVFGGNNAFNAIVLSNSRKSGYYWSATAKLEKQFGSGLSAMLAYTRSDARTIFDGTGDQLLNTWSGNFVVNNANNPQLSYANYVVPDRIIASLAYRKEYLKHLATQVSFFYSGSIQGRYSYIYSSDFNRDGQTNDLIYIPRDASEITFSTFNYGGTVGTLTGAQQNVLFQQFIDQDSYLSKHRGEYAERNGATLPWRHQVDFRIAQDIFVAAKTRNTLQVTLDIFNFGNFLNRNWGIYQVPVVGSVSAGSGILTPTNQAALIAGSAVTPTFRLNTYGGAPINTSYVNTISTASTYYMQVGVRYSFN